MPNTVLFMCQRNAGISVMAEVLFNSHTEVCVATSAGIEPAKSMHKQVVSMMDELRLDVGGKQPRKFDDPTLKDADIIVDMNCGVSKILPPEYSSKLILWPLEVPEYQQADSVRRARDIIRDGVKWMSAVCGWAPERSIPILRQVFGVPVRIEREEIENGESSSTSKELANVASAYAESQGVKLSSDEATLIGSLMALTAQKLKQIQD